MNSPAGPSSLGSLPGASRWRQLAWAATLLLLGPLMLSALPACAWSNPANRPVWNAFEEHWVPDSDPAFSWALPLTIPAGLLAIVVDVVLVHPLSIVDDAWNSAVSNWDDIDWQRDYWFETGVAPFRALGTGIDFVVQLVSRALFDIPAFGEEPSVDRVPGGESRSSAEASAGDELTDPAAARRAQAMLREWLQDLLRGDDRSAEEGWVEGHVSSAVFDAELQELAVRVLSAAPYRARISYFRWAARHTRTGLQGLADADARVRAALLVDLAGSITIPADLRRALLHDPDPVVAELAWQLLPADSGDAGSR